MDWKVVLQVVLTIIGAVAAVWIMVPLIMKRFPNTEQAVDKAHDAIDTVTDFAEEIFPEYVDNFDLIRHYADIAVTNVYQLLKVGTITDKDEALKEAVKFINGALKMEGFTDEFITEHASVIEGITRSAVFAMNYLRDKNMPYTP